MRNDPMSIRPTNDVLAISSPPFADIYTIPQRCCQFLSRKIIFERSSFEPWVIRWLNVVPFRQDNGGGHDLKRRIPIHPRLRLQSLQVLPLQVHQLLRLGLAQGTPFPQRTRPESDHLPYLVQTALPGYGCLRHQLARYRGCP